MKCECRICQRHRKFSKHIKLLEDYPELKETTDFFNEIYNLLNNVELDRDVNQAIVRGEWHSSEEIIESFRKE